ncbi:MAG: glyoxalase [Lactobacillaceae bacterium]|jgi:hypothetical protein|nr:glyoxalase [Lactobacillaceae bacterium]
MKEVLKLISKSRVMLYVHDVDQMATFWTEELQTTIVETMALPAGYHGQVIKISDEFELVLFPKEFAQKYSPEVPTTMPSLMFYSNRFEQMYKIISTAGEITDNNGTATFNFHDPEGNYFVMAKA